MIAKLCNRERRVLAFRPAGRGFGFAALEGTGELLDWGLKEARPYDLSKLLKRASQLLDRLIPTLVVVEKPSAKRRSQRAHELASGLRTSAEKAGFAVRSSTVRSARAILHLGEGLRQYETARCIALKFPELRSKLPTKRRPWMSQDARFAIFEAVTIGLSAYRMRRVITHTE